MAHATEMEPHKRKRDTEDIGNQLGARSQLTGFPQAATANAHPINYLPTPNAPRLALIQGDADIFVDILDLLNAYEGVLDRNESLAASLGAKLTGPRFLRGIERFFDGPIKVQVNPIPPFPSPISWVDVVAFAKTNQNAFNLTTLPDGSRCCRFVCKGLQVEIAEDDWRLISSGALDRFPLEHPFEEDETAELATLDILEQRSSTLYKKADEVAARARILHHRLEQRRQELKRRRGGHESNSLGPLFHSANQSQRSPTFASTSYDLHADLLQQFASSSTPITPMPIFARAPASIPAPLLSRPTSSESCMPVASLGPLSPRSCAISPHRQRIPGQSIFATTPRPAESTTVGSTSLIVFDTSAEIYRALVMQKTDKLGKWETIDPPCDRCRRLRLQCVKHLTACQGCTKKHAKCSWKSVTEEEAAKLRHELGVPGPHLGGEAKTTSESEASSSRDSGVGGSIGSGASVAPPHSLNTLASNFAPSLASTLGPTHGLTLGPVSDATVIPLGNSAMEPVSRPPSRSNSPVSALATANSEMGPGGKVNSLAEPRRTSLPTERLGNGPFHGSREQTHIGQISTLLSPTAYNLSFGGVLSNPPSR